MRFLLYLVLPFVLINMVHSYTVKEIRSDLNAYQNQIELLKANFSISVEGLPTNQTAVQKGVLTYSSSGGSSLKYTSPVAMTMEIKPDGYIYLNGQKSSMVSSSYQMGDMYLVYYLNNYDLKIKSENSNSVLVEGYPPSRNGKNVVLKPVLRFNFLKDRKVIDMLSYFGSGNDIPFELRAEYETVKGLPVMKLLVVHMVAFSVNMVSKMKLDGFELTLK